MTSTAIHIRTVLLNLLVFLALVAALILVPPILFDLYSGFRAKDNRASLPNYKDVVWARKHFEEFARLRTAYHDFIGWRRVSFDGATIAIDSEGYRRHPDAPKRETAEVWVFGGSAVWGPGAKDALTIPARIQAHSRKSTFNFGEAGYTAHQSYNLLIKNYLLGGKPQHVVFYDGANEVVVKCRSELTFYSAMQESTLRERLRGGSSTLAVFAPTLDVLGRVAAKVAASPPLAGPGFYDCHANEAKRKLIAASLVLDWKLAGQLVAQNGGTFIPVLQPVSYVGAPNLDHLPSVRADDLLRRQYEALYPEIVRQLREAGLAFADLTQAFDGKDLLYIDFVHVSPQGNDLAAKRIAALLK